MTSASRGSAFIAFRIEISDFGAFYERTYAVAFRSALGVVPHAIMLDIDEALRLHLGL